MSSASVCSRLAESADSEGNCNYINLHAQLMLNESATMQES